MLLFLKYILLHDRLDRGHRHEKKKKKKITYHLYCLFFKIVMDDLN